MPPTSCGARIAFGIHGGRRLGLDIHRHRALNAECVSGMCASEATASPPFRNLHGACEAECQSTSAGERRGGWPCEMDHGSWEGRRSFTDQIKFWGIQPSYAFVEQPQTNGVAERFKSHAQGTDHPWPHLPQHRRAAERRPRVRRTVQCPVVVEKNGYLSPAQARQGVALTAMSLRPDRMRQTWSKEPGAIHAYVRRAGSSTPARW